MARNSERPWFARTVQVVAVVAATINLGGVLGATLTGNSVDVDRYGPYVAAYAALAIAIGARWPRQVRSDDRECPPVQGDTK